LKGSRSFVPSLVIGIWHGTLRIETCLHYKKNDWRIIAYGIQLSLRTK